CLVALQHLFGIAPCQQMLLILIHPEGERFSLISRFTRRPHSPTQHANGSDKCHGENYSKPSGHSGTRVGRKVRITGAKGIRFEVASLPAPSSIPPAATC